MASVQAHADIPPGYTVLETITYEYDADGNRISRSATVGLAPETPIEAHYDQGNRLTQLTLKGLGQNGVDTTCTLTYDANGNLNTKTCQDAGSTTSPAITTYTWDSRNRLTQIQSPGIDARFQYDPLGRRIERTVNGDTTHYLYDGSQAIAELDDGNTVSASYLTGLAIDEVIARYTTEGERTLLTDALGSVILSTKEDTTITTAYGYSAYGETQVYGTDEHNPIQYTAREHDDTGLYYYRARYYDPQLKRFISEDPIGIDGGINVYAYVDNSPLNMSDPLGLLGVGTPGYTPSAPGVGGGRLGVFGCIGGCLSYTQGDAGTQASISPSLGGGIMICSGNNKPNDPANCRLEEQQSQDCGMHDPNCDNNIQPSISITRLGVGVGMATNSDGSYCLLVGPFVSYLVPLSYNLGNIDE